MLICAGHQPSRHPERAQPLELPRQLGPLEGLDQEIAVEAGIAKMRFHLGEIAAHARADIGVCGERRGKHLRASRRASHRQELRLYDNQRRKKQQQPTAQAAALPTPPAATSAWRAAG